jgi:hypothetical protein
MEKLSEVSDDDMRLFLKECILSGAQVQTMTKVELDPNEISKHLYALVRWEDCEILYWLRGGAPGKLLWYERYRNAFS